MSAPLNESVRHGTKVVTSGKPAFQGLREIAILRALGVAALIVAALLTLPVAVYPLGIGGEFQYQAAMTVAFREHLQWGSQIVSTYGPYGYMDEPTFLDFNTWALAFAANLAGHVALFAVLALFLFRIKARPWQWVLVAVVIVLSFDRYASAKFERFPVLDIEAAMAAMLLLYLAAETPSRRLASLYAGIAGLVIGYLFLDKGTFILVGGALVAVYLVLDLSRRRIVSVLSLLGGVVAAFLVLWLLAGQSIEGIPAYFRTVVEVIGGYTPAMSRFRQPGATYPSLQLGLGVATLAATGVSLLVTLWRRDWSLFRLLLLTSPLLYFIFKNSFVRFSELHAFAFWALVAFLQGLVLVRAMATTETRGRAPAVIASVTVLACVLLVGGLGPIIGGVPRIHPTLDFRANFASYRLAASLITEPDRRAAEEAQVEAALRAAYPLPSNVVDYLRQGTVDVLPIDLQLAIAYGFHWDPRPVLQSYQAYRPFLDHVDAQHYLGPQAPRFVLFALKSIDGRYPLFDEPEVYRVLFERYQVRDRTSNLLILERRPDAPLVAERPAGGATGRLDGWIPVPPHGDQRMYGRVQVDYTLLGQFMTLFHQPPELHIRFKYGGGRISPLYRFVPGVAPDGLDLSAYVSDISSVERMAAGQFDQPIEAIQIVADPPVAAYQSQVRVAFFTVAAVQG